MTSIAVSELVHMSIGIPQGLFVDEESGDEVGAVRLAGEIASIDMRPYALWTMLLTPMAADAVDVALAQNGYPDISQELATLRERGLIIAVASESGDSANHIFADLRPIPLGVGLGIVDSATGRFGLQNTSHSLLSAVTLDFVGTLLWWEFDGATSVAEAVARVMERVSTLARPAAWAVVGELVVGLMTNRLLYLDAPRAIIEGGDH